MRRSDFLLVVLVILFLGFVFWAFYTGRFNAVAGSLIDEIWDSIQGMLRPIFRR
jgi:H+/Cl- antiporter ClcA